MPSVVSSVGSTPIPFPVGDEGSPVVDHATNVLLSYFAHWIRESLNAKLSDLGGTKRSQEDPTDACPIENLFPYSHEVVWPQNPRPALYLWWGGTSQTIPKTLAYDLRQRVLNFTWIYTEMHSPDNDARAGLLSVVDGAIRRAVSRGTHPTWIYSDSERTYPAGMSAGRVAGIHEWQLGQTQSGVFAPTPENPGSREGPEQNFYPALLGTITIWERIGVDSFDRQTDANVESHIQVNTSENGGFVEEPLTVAETVVLVP